MCPENDKSNSLLENKRKFLANVILNKPYSETERIARLKHIGYLSESLINATINTSLPETATGKKP